MDSIDFFMDRLLMPPVQSFAKRVYVSLCENTAMFMLVYSAGGHGHKPHQKAALIFKEIDHDHGCHVHS